MTVAEFAKDSTVERRKCLVFLVIFRAAPWTKQFLWSLTSSVFLNFLDAEQREEDRIRRQKEEEEQERKRRAQELGLCD